VNGWLGRVGRFLFAAIYGRDGNNGEGEAYAYGERWYRMRVSGGRVNDGFLDS
jgi:hypothetical protein